MPDNYSYYVRSIPAASGTGVGYDAVDMPTATAARSRDRAQIADAHKWNLDDIFPDWVAWEAGRAELDRRVDEFAELKGTLGASPERLRAAFLLNDDLGQLAYKVHFYASLK